MGWAEGYLLWCVGLTLKHCNGLDKDELEFQVYGFIGGYISTLALLKLSDIKQKNQLDLFNYLYFVRHSNHWFSKINGSHPNPQRGMDII